MKTLLATPEPDRSCAACRDPLTGKHVTNFWGVGFHEHHATCTACSYPTLDAGTDPYCHRCGPTRVNELEVALRRGRIVRHLMQYRLLQIPAGLVSFQLVDQTDGPADSLGLTKTRTTRGADSVENRFVVQVKKGLPAVQFDSVVAHELTHVWMTLVECDLPKLDNEGIAETSSYWLLGNLGGTLAAALQHRIRHNPDPIYGEGFRKWREVERREGWKRVIAQLRTGRDLPWAA